MFQWELMTLQDCDDLSSTEKPPEPSSSGLSPPVLPPPRPLSPIGTYFFPPWEPYKYPSLLDGLKRHRNKRLGSPPEARPRKAYLRSGPIPHPDPQPMSPLPTIPDSAGGPSNTQNGVKVKPVLETEYASASDQGNSLSNAKDDDHIAEDNQGGDAGFGAKLLHVGSEAQVQVSNPPSTHVL